MEEQVLLSQWFHYEQVAMHFNELLIQYRTTIMGGTALLLTFVGYIGSGKSIKSDSALERVYSAYKNKLFVGLMVTVLFYCALRVDLGYYNKLLVGAVEALIELESKHSHLSLSTTISCQFSQLAMDVCLSTSGAKANIEADTIFWVYYFIFGALIVMNLSLILRLIFLQSQLKKKAVSKAY